MFRTASGQTGYDAYQYEAAQIANAQRDLNERFTRLVQIMHDEVPEMFPGSTDFQFSSAISAPTLLDRLRDRKTKPAKRYRIFIYPTITGERGWFAPGSYDTLEHAKRDLPLIQSCHPNNHCAIDEA
jgi:hypothetical protein